MVAVDITQKVGLSPAEVAAITGLSETLVRQMIRNGTIKSRRFGRRIVVGRAALEAFLNAKEETPA